ncbi:hypothetical protein, partial [Neisseria dumasiana]|uniref:hypothetical protein n=1 Tax=Neisseria dumasiana TaxID=1931275 RepID=UPI00209BE055
MQFVRAFGAAGALQVAFGGKQPQFDVGEFAGDDVVAFGQAEAQKKKKLSFTSASARATSSPLTFR